MMRNRKANWKRERTRAFQRIYDAVMECRRAPEARVAPADTNQPAKPIVELASAGADDRRPENPAAKRGRARAEKLSAEEGGETAANAAMDPRTR